MRLLNFIGFVFAAAALLACGAANSPDGGVQAESAWIRASVPGSKVSAGYLTLRNTSSEDDAVVAVEIPGVGKAEVHSMSHSEGMMRMRPVESLPLPAGQTVQLQPGGTHLMLMGVEEAFELGSQRSGRIRLRSGQTLELRFDIRNQAPNS